MKRISPRIMDSAFGFLENKFKSVNAGAEFVIDLMPRFFYYGLCDIDCFTDDELALFIYIMDVKLLPTSVGCYLLQGLRDSYLVSTADFLHVSRSEVIKKLRALPVFSLICLEIWAASFWTAGGRGGDHKAVLKYVIKFVRDNSFKS